MFEIIPAILVRDSGEYRSKLIQIENLVPKVHIDIMDGRFVPNVTVSLNEIGSIPTNLKKSAHLMINNPQTEFANLTKFKFNSVTIHFEAFNRPKDLFAALNQARNFNLKVSLCLSPNTLETSVKDYLTHFDEITVMSVDPGFSGQKYRPETIGKVARIRRLYPELLIAVDGGINTENIKEYYEAGARVFIIGSGIFNDQPKFSLERFKKVLTETELSNLKST